MILTEDSSMTHKQKPLWLLEDHPLFQTSSREGASQAIDYFG